MSLINCTPRVILGSSVPSKTPNLTLIHLITCWFFFVVFFYLEHQFFVCTHKRKGLCAIQPAIHTDSFFDVFYTYTQYNGLSHRVPKILVF